MSRQDKIGSLVLGLVLFSGLFYFIYSTMNNPLPAEFGDEAFAGDYAGDEALEEELSSIDETAAETPAADAEAAPPAAAPAPEKK